MSRPHGRQQLRILRPCRLYPLAAQRIRGRRIRPDGSYLGRLRRRSLLGPAVGRGLGPLASLGFGCASTCSTLCSCRRCLSTYA